MTTRRRRRASKEEEHPPWFSRPQIVNMLAVPVLTLIGGLVGWYYLTSDTLKRHEGEIAAMKSAARTTVDEERKAREEVRKAFMDNIVSQTSVLGKLDARLTVQESKVDITNRTLEKIADKLDNLNKAIK